MNIRATALLCCLACIEPTVASSACLDCVGVDNPPWSQDYVSEQFVANDQPPVDVLFVIDTSCFSEEQESLGDAIDSLLQFLAGRDWHLGIVSSDMERPDHRGRLQGEPLFMTPNTPEPHETFAQNVALGRDGSIHEKFFRAARTALDGSLPENVGFRRPEATLELIFATDQDDEDSTPVADEVAALRDLGQVRMHVLSGGFPGWCDRFAPTRLWAVQEAFAGERGNRCDDRDDYGRFLHDVGKSLAAPSSYVLEGTALPGEMEVAVISDNGTVMTYVDAEHDESCDDCAVFVYDGAAVHLTPPARTGSMVRVSYRTRL